MSYAEELKRENADYVAQLQKLTQGTEPITENPYDIALEGMLTQYLMWRELCKDKQINKNKLVKTLEQNFYDIEHQWLALLNSEAFKNSGQYGDQTDYFTEDNIDQVKIYLEEILLDKVSEFTIDKKAMSGINLVHNKLQEQLALSMADDSVTRVA